MAKYNIPGTGFMSYSKWKLWKDDPQAFVRRYFWDTKYYESEFLDLGKIFSKALDEKDEWALSMIPEPVLLDVIQLDEPEYRFETYLGDVPVRGFMDTARTDLSRFGEYKTGLEPYPVERIKKYGQLDFYSAAAYVTTGSIPDCFLQWFETTYDKKVESDLDLGDLELEPPKWTGKNVRFTGKSELVEYKTTPARIDKLIKDLQNVTEEITDAYNEYLKQSDNMFDPTLVEEMKDIERRLGYHNAAVKDLRDRKRAQQRIILSEMELNGLKVYTDDEVSITRTEKGNFSMTKR